ncbi:MAG: NUDIX hydrolase [Candidatus Helarchaeota archaeon]
MDPLFQKIKSILEKRQRYIVNDERLTPAAVLLILFIKNNEPYGIFEKRTQTLNKHKGEIALPGGRLEKNDKDLLDTALRETEEEIDVYRSKISVLGELDDLFTVSKYAITPYVGYINYPYVSKINTQEVAELIEIPLSVFQRYDNFREKIWDYNGIPHPIFYYDYVTKNKTYTIWGATGYIMNIFTEIVFNFNPSKTRYKRRNPEIFLNKLLNKS